MGYKIKSWCKSNLLFVILLLIFLVFSFDSTLDKPPTGQHLWRQTDCLSMTQQYAEGAPFFEPQMHIQLGDDNTSGKSAGEFPILYYTVGKIWAFFGQNILTYRLIFILILFFGIFSLYKTMELVLKNKFWSITLTLLFISSPAYIFYSVNFLTDGAAYSFTLIALYFFTQYCIGVKKRHFYFVILFFTIAGLIKVSSLIAFVFLGFIYLIELFPIATMGYRKLYQNRKFESLLFVLVPGLIFSWYLYAHHYNNLHHFKYTFNNIFPLWKMNKIELELVINKIASFSSYIFYSRPFLYLLVLICSINIFSWRKINLLAYTTNVVILIGSIVYFILWAPLMGEHDYYYNAILILAPAIIIPFIWNLKENYFRIYSNRTVKTLFSLFVFYNLWYCASIVQLKGHSSIAKHAIIRNEKLINEMEWFNWNNTSNLYRLVRIQPQLQEMNINKSDKVIIIPDNSFNTTLYLLNRKGWTNFMNYSTSADIDNLIDKGAKYLFILDDHYLTEEYLQPFFTHPIKEIEGVKIYKL